MAAGWEGLDDMLDDIDDLADAATTGLGLRLRAEGELIMTDVKAARAGKGVPVDTGALRSSGQVSGPKKEGGREVVRLTFGGPAAPYALVQHEDQTLSHDVGEARYLVRGLKRRKRGDRPEKALKAMLDQAQQAVAA